MSAGFSTPILFIIFNRLDITRRAFEVIRKIQPARLYIASDGPQENQINEESQVKAVRAYVMGNIDWECKVETLFREKNLGCGLGPSLAISWLFEHEEEGIILEDDCLADLSFFPFCRDLLEKYRTDRRVMVISGNNFLQRKNFRPPESYFFLKYPNTWGWATWKRAWKYFDIKMEKWPQARENKTLAKTLDPNEYFLWQRDLDDVFLGKITGVWDFQWVFTCWMQETLAISPTVNLVSNIGFGDESTHTKGYDPLRANLPTRSIGFPLIHPKNVVANRQAEKLMQDIFYHMPMWPYFRLLLKERMGLGRLVKK